MYAYRITTAMKQPDQRLQCNHCCKNCKHLLITNWTPLSELEVISAETVPVRMFSGNQYGNHEVTYTWNRGEQKEFWLLVLRIFVNGDFDVSPADLLPDMDDKDKDNKCACVLLWVTGNDQWCSQASRLGAEHARNIISFYETVAIANIARIRIPHQLINYACN